MKANFKIKLWHHFSDVITITSPKQSHKIFPIPKFNDLQKKQSCYITGATFHPW